MASQRLTILKKMKKIGILKADPVNPKLSRQYGEYADMITRALKTAIPKFECKVYDLHKFEYPKDIDEVDVYFITGSSASVYEDLPWIHGLCDFVRLLDKHKKKTIGLCFGHQLIAHALGGKVACSPKGWSIGIKIFELTKEGKKQIGDAPPFQLINSHRDQVMKLPRGCKVLAGNDFCPIYIFQKEQHIFTVQGHIEMTTDYASSLYQLRANLFEPSVYQKAIASLNESHDYELVTKWITNFIWPQ